MLQNWQESIAATIWNEPLKAQKGDIQRIKEAGAETMGADNIATVVLK